MHRLLQGIKIASVTGEGIREASEGSSAFTLTAVGIFTCRQRGLVEKDLASVIDRNVNDGV